MSPVHFLGHFITYCMFFSSPCFILIKYIWYSWRQTWIMLALERNDLIAFVHFQTSCIQSKCQSIQSVNKTCVFRSLAHKKLPCGVCYWKIIFEIIFLITGLSLGILPPLVKSSAIWAKQTEMQSSTVTEIYFYCSKNWLSIFHNQF